jgi:hypothetical protein
MPKKIVGHKSPILLDPIRALAQGISISREDNVWDEIPVSLPEFIEGKQYLNQKWNGRLGCRPKLMDILKEAVKPEKREIVFLLGKGSGKDFGSAILHLYGIYRCLCMTNPQAYYGLSPSPIYFVNTARNETQARKVFFSQFVALLKDCPWFQGKFAEPGTMSVSFIKNIEALSVNSQAFGWLGFNILQWVGDELAFFLEKDEDEESASRAEDCWEAAYGSCQTRFPRDYKIIGITTPRFDDDFVMKKFTELKNREDGYAVQAATWDINPNITKEDFKHAFIRDYKRTMRDFGAIPMGVMESFWPQPDTLEQLCSEECKNCPVYKNRLITEDMFACYDYDDCKCNGYMGGGNWREWFVPDPKIEDYYMHFDLAINKCRIGFALGGSCGKVKVELDTFNLKQKFGDNFDKEQLDKEDFYETRPIIKIVALGFITTEARDRRLLKNNEFYYVAIRNHIIFSLKEKGFNIAKITFDSFQSHDMAQILEDHGIGTDLLSCDRDDSVPRTGKYSILEQRVIYPYSQLLCNEAKYLKYVNAKKVDHARGTCFTGDTKVSLLNGDEISHKELFEKYGNNPFYVYSLDLEKKKFVPGKAKCLGIIKRDKIMKITLDNGKEIKCSYDHKFLLRNCEYVEAQKLKIGDSLFPLYRERELGKNRSSLYESYKDIFEDFSWKRTHSMVVKGLGLDTKNKFIHHKDFDSLNNDPENLQLMSFDDHRNFHKELSSRRLKELWKNKEYREKMVFLLRNCWKKKEYREIIFKKRKEWFLDPKNKQRFDEIMKSESVFLKRWRAARSVLEEKIRIRNKSIRLAWTEEKRRKQGHKLEKITDNDRKEMIEMVKNGAVMWDLMDRFNCSGPCIDYNLKKIGFRNLLDARKKLVSNHKVIKLEFTDEIEDLYCLSVEKYENYALSAGVFVKNSKDLWDSFAGTIFLVDSNALITKNAWSFVENDSEE